MQHSMSFLEIDIHVSVPEFSSAAYRLVAGIYACMSARPEATIRFIPSSSNNHTSNNHTSYFHNGANCVVFG